MVTHSIIPSKITLPRARVDVVLRPRVMEMLTAGLKGALTLVSAPAGYGKTTLIVSWLHGWNAHCAWYSLGGEDDDLSRFIAYLIAALQQVQPTIGKSAAQILEDFNATAIQTDSILASLIRDLAQFSQPKLLVLEDYHFIESTAIHTFVENIIEHAQPHLHIVITTRADPPLPLAKWRARNQLTEVHAANLQFTPDEATEFLQNAMRLDLSHQDIRLLAEQTEGWAVGLQLAALSIRNHHGPWRLEGGQRDIADYLMTEVVDQLPAARRAFLLQTSLVSRLNASLCNALTEREDSQLMLEALEGDNLFTFALDEARDCFRYHHLFGEFLYKRLQAEYPESAVNSLHQRASRWLAENSFIPEAIDHALAARDYRYAASLIAPQAAQWMRHGETFTILKYLNRLPRDLAWNQWALCLWYGWSYAVNGDLNAAKRWTDRLEALITPLMQDALIKEMPIPTDIQNVYAQVLAIRSMLARQDRNFDSALALGEEALRLVPEGSLNLRTIISTLLASAALKAGRFDQTESILRATRQTAYRAGNPFITFTILLNESDLVLTRAQLHRARDLNLEILQLTQNESMQRLAFAAEFRLGRIHYLWNQLPQAKEYIATALEHADAEEYLVTTVQGYNTLALIQNAEGQVEQALRTLAEAEALAVRRGEAESAQRIGGIRAQIQLSAREDAAVIRWFKSSGWESFNPHESNPMFSDESFFASCQILIASSNPDEWKRVEGLLAWRLADAKRQGKSGVTIKIHLMQALLQQAKNHPERAMAALLLALEHAMPENIARPFLDEGKPLIPLLRRVPRKHASRRFALNILAGDSGAPPTQGSLVEPLSEQELGILQLMAQGCTNPEIARKRMLAVSTVHWYAKQIYRKMGVHNRTQATTQAGKLNLL